MPLNKIVSKHFRVTAYRWGSYETKSTFYHQYIVGECESLDEAFKLAINEYTFRGGKYSCEIFDTHSDTKVVRADCNPKDNQWTLEQYIEATKQLCYQE